MHYAVKRVAAFVLSVTISVLPLHSYAGEKTLPELGREAQVLGQEIADGLNGQAGQVQNGTLSFPGQFDINVNDLFPGTSSSNKDPESYYFPESAWPDVDGLQDIYDSSRSMDDYGSAARGPLWQDANSADPSVMGGAYKVLLDAANRSRPDFTNDPVLNLSRKTYEDIDIIAAGFGDCSAETIISQNTTSTHVPEYERCQRMVDRSGDCEIFHDYDASVVKHYDGPFNLKGCGEGCVELWIGRIGDNYWAGNCTIYEEFTRIQVVNPEAILSATLEYAKWDDYMQVWVGKTSAMTKVWNGPNDNFPPETEGACELKTSWAQTLNTDVTQYFKDVLPEDVVTFKIRVSVSGHGEGFGRIRILYDQSKAVTKDEWTPTSCLQAAQGITDGFATGSITCTDDPTDSTGCTIINGITVCENQLKETGLPGVPKLCKKVSVRASFDYWKGQMECWTDPQGETHCPDNNIDNPQLNGCVELESNPQCGFISSNCMDGAQGASGTCYVFKDTYDCGYDVSVPTLDKTTEYNCGGAISCMGDECLDIKKTESLDFSRAVALLNTAQFMTQDMNCLGVDENGNPIGDQDVVCSIFSGKAGECKIAIGGAQNCCEKPSNVSLADYLQLIMAVPKLDGAIMSLQDGNALRGAYQVLRDPVLQGWSEVTKPFTSYIENISGTVKSFVEPAKQFVDGLINQLKSKVKEIMTKILSSASQDAATDAAVAGMADQAAEQAADAFVTQATAWLSVAMTIYTIYVVAMLLVQIIWKCEEKEFTMNAQRVLKNCTYVGSYCKNKVLGKCIEERESYCCFNSPLSRIIQEQVRPQLGLTFGSAKQPQCEGIPLDKIGEIDWTLVNLDEWLGLLQVHGAYPEAANINFDMLTGSGSDFNIDGARTNTLDRTLERLQGINVDAKRQEAADLILPETGAPKGE